MTVLLPPTRTVDIVWQAGDDTPAVLPVPDTDGRPLDVTGWDASVEVVHNGRAVHAWSTDDDTAECGPGGVTLHPEDSASWMWWRGRYELHLTAPDGHQRTPTVGDMLVRAPRPAGDVVEPELPVPPGTLLMRHGDSWESPAFALHTAGVPLALEGWFVRAQARAEGAARPLFSWSARLTQPGLDVEVSTTRWRRADRTEVTLPTVAVLLRPDDWPGKPREWEGRFEVELTRGDLTEPQERRTIAPARPLRIVPDLIP